MPQSDKRGSAEVEAWQAMQECDLCRGAGPFSSCVHYLEFTKALNEHSGDGGIASLIERLENSVTYLTDWTGTMPEPVDQNIPKLMAEAAEALRAVSHTAPEGREHTTLDFLRDERFTGSFIERFVDDYAAASGEEKVQELLNFAVALVGELAGPEFELFCVSVLGPQASDTASPQREHQK
jgi:hypothetical protein